MNKKIKVAFFGCGNMGRSLASALMKAYSQNLVLHFYTPSQNKARACANEFNGVFIESLSQMPADMDWYILAFKPQSLKEFNFEFSKNSRVVSLLAGISLDAIKSKFKLENVVRLMPNISSLYGAGANLYFCDEHLPRTDEQSFLYLFKASGKLFKVSSDLELNLATPFSGSGPALIFEFARIFENELNRVSNGCLNARDIINQTFLGASILMINSQSSFEEMRNQVTSKKGVTQEALDVLDNENFEGILKKSFKAAIDRTIELSK